VIVVPLRERRVRFHGIVMLDRGRIDLVDRQSSLRQSGIHIAPTLIARFPVMRVGIRAWKSGAVARFVLRAAIQIALHSQ
jgi:hypothetical protein